MTPDFLVTHSGGFHADEVMSSVILTKLFPAAQIVRTRAAEWIAPAADRIIYDVGGAYDAEARIFDHHQRGAPRREDDQPYSSFGLVWKHYGRDYLTASGIAAEHLDAIHAKFDTTFVLPVDLVDNGALDVSSAGVLVGLTLPALIETLKPVFDETDPEAELRGFMGALGIARSFVEANIARSAAKLRAEALVHQAIVAAGESRILELPMGMPFRPAVIKAGADHLLFVVNPRDKDWSLTGIRKADEGFELRADLPVAWAGLTNGDLEEASGVPGAVFCHNGRFIAAAKTREAILAMAEIAVREALASAA
ncbi:metal-dependent hydrolase [Devosia epidermidihirudinis]|uniref:Metal-dependent hydrolase n=1 Tax=Devosia epidermidihirudinis TaxID=1293439 RepID=A0A0F5QBH3_9HYPH|nr:MYG1 family protein [Devosia epidermidihirudinis]KKC38046.1 metal-dependent hydrolase [Devosia epidermidihirudinis]